MDLLEALDAQLYKHPNMEPEDVIKLVYQNEFGPAHMLASGKTKEQIFAGIREEFRTVEYNEDEPLYENIGNGYVRLNFNGVDVIDYPVEKLCEDVVSSAEEAPKGDPESFKKKLYSVQAHFDEFPFGFSEEKYEKAVEAYLASCKDGVYPPVHHSALYRKTEEPHYRVILRKKEHDFVKEQAKKESGFLKVLKRILWILFFLAILAGISVLGKYLYGVLVV